jgi:hypothetical protein
MELHSQSKCTSSNGSSKSIDWGCGGGKWQEHRAKRDQNWWRFTADWELWAQFVYISFQNWIGTKLSICCKITVLVVLDFHSLKSNHVWICILEPTFMPHLTAAIGEFSSTQEMLSRWFGLLFNVYYGLFQKHQLSHSTITFKLYTYAHVLRLKKS